MVFAAARAMISAKDRFFSSGAGVEAVLAGLLASGFDDNAFLAAVDELVSRPSFDDVERGFLDVKFDCVEV